MFINYVRSSTRIIQIWGPRQDQGCQDHIKKLNERYKSFTKVKIQFIIIGEVQQVDPKEMGSQPPKWQNPTKVNLRHLYQPTY